MDNLPLILAGVQILCFAMQLTFLAQAKRQYRLARKHYERAGEQPIEGPRGVWALYADGARYEDLATLYVDRFQGIARFEILLPRDPNTERPVEIGADEMPAHTAIGFAYSHEPDDRA